MKALKWCLLSSLCEPAAAIVFGMLFNRYLTRQIMAALNAVGMCRTVEVDLLVPCDAV